MSCESRVLAVDDDRNVVHALEELLAGECTVEGVFSGEQALRTANTFRPDVVLLDVTMPGMDGYQTCQQLRSQQSHQQTPVIMLSALDEAPARIAAYDAGADDYISKPFDTAELRAKVNAWLRRREQPANSTSPDQAESLLDALGVALTTVVDFQRVESAEHLFRVQWYSLKLVEELRFHSAYSMQIDEVFMRNVYRTSPLHDIGMLAVRAEIISKTDSLSRSEWREMTEHTHIGAELLERAFAHACDPTLACTAANIARYHHERYNGGGYPAGLKGNEIPLEARIVAVADVFDALTSDRSYRAAFTPQKAAAIIEQEAGKQFDPIVVNAFSRRFDDIIAPMSETATRRLSTPSEQLIEDALNF